VSELERRIEAARDLLEVEVTPRDTAHALVRLEAGRRRRARRRAVGAAAGALALAAGALLALWPSPDPGPLAPAVVVADQRPAPEAPTRSGPVGTGADPAQADARFVTDADAPTRTVVFSDGSLAKLTRAETELVLDVEREDLLELSLERGEARFNVEKNPKRRFRVRTVDLAVEVLGTRFTVETTPDGGTKVSVDRGRVAVIRDEDRHELGPGMRFSFDGTRAVIEDARAPARAKKKRRGARRRRAAVEAAPEPSASPAWEQLAADGRYSEAYDAMGGAEAQPSDPKSLMLAADVARLSGHPREAVRHLREVVRAHRRQPQGMLAAFTLGRILQRELKQPKEAAEAYHLARSLAPSGSLAEDALAHEAECRARAGQAEAASALADQYLRQYPWGRKAGTMRRLVGSEP